MTGWITIGIRASQQTGAFDSHSATRLNASTTAAHSAHRYRYSGMKSFLSFVGNAAWWAIPGAFAMAAVKGYGLTVGAIAAAVLLGGACALWVLHALLTRLLPGRNRRDVRGELLGLERTGREPPKL